MVRLTPIFVRDLSAGRTVTTFVIWADAGVIGAASTNGHALIANTVPPEEGFPIYGTTNVHSADSVMKISALDALPDADETSTNGADLVTFETDPDGESDGDEVLAGIDLLTLGVADSAATAHGANTGFTAGTTVVTMGRVNRQGGASRQGEGFTELAAHTSLTVTATVENSGMR